MRTSGDSRTGARRNINRLAIKIGAVAVGGFLAIIAGCAPILQQIAEGITGIPVAGIPTPTQIATPTPLATSTPIGPTATPTPGPVQVMISTNLGNIVVSLNSAQAPITVSNFLQYVDAGFYSNLIFHRSVQSGIFIVQSGGYYATCQQPQTNPPIASENNGVKNVRGTIAMALNGSSSGTILDTATSQFFFNNQDNPSLDFTSTTPGYTVFGTVVSGQGVVDQIAALPILDADSLCSGLTPPTPFNTKPCPNNDINQSVVIFSVTRQ